MRDAEVAEAGQKKAREIWFLSRLYDAQEALAMGLVNAVVPLAQLEAETLSWCALHRCRLCCNTPGTHSSWPAHPARAA